MKKDFLRFILPLVVVACTVTTALSMPFVYQDMELKVTMLEYADLFTPKGSMDFPDGIASTGFTYNDFGAMTADSSRGISEIAYDNFGNPTKIQYTDNRSTSNVYSAAGEKLKTVHVTGLATRNDAVGIFGEGTFAAQKEDINSVGANGQSTIEYHGNVRYRNDKVDMVLFPGGYATINGTLVTFHYYTQDYLGNNRAVINGSTGTIEQTVAYYPYGGIIVDLSSVEIPGQPYKFGGKELITANGLNEYDFGARLYYPAVPGFTKPDPIAENYYWLSPYLYCANNPVNLIDKDGRDIWCLDEMGHVINSESFDGFDLLLVYDQNMKEKSSWLGEYGSISNQSTIKDGDGMKCSVFEAINDEVGTGVFEFLANNTSVEWSQFKTGDNESMNNYLTSSHEKAFEGGASALVSILPSSTHIREWTHSHPNNTDYPSGIEPGSVSGDIPFARKIDAINPIQAQYRIYLPSIDNRSYINYNSDHTIFNYKRFVNNLNEINIFAPTKK